MATQGLVEVSANGGSTHTGTAVERFRLISLKSALGLESHGIRLSRKMSALAIAKQVTGLRTNDRAAHISRLNVMIAEIERGVTFEVRS